MEKEFDWHSVKQLSPAQVFLAFFLPSIFAYTGFRLVLPSLVELGFPKVMMWPAVASVMLLLFTLIGLYLNKKEAKELGVGLKERLCLKRISKKAWALSIGILFLGLIMSIVAQTTIPLFMKVTGLSIPDYMPFWLDPSINPMQTDMEILSPGYPIKGNVGLVVLMGITLLLNIFAEEVYFRAWLLPKMQKFGKLSWIVNGLLFALYHSFQLWLFPMLATLSLATTLSVYLSKSLWPAFTIHLIANFLLSILGILALVFG